MKTQIIGLQGQRPSKTSKTAATAKGRRKVEEQARAYAKIVERYAKSIDRPEVRLRFLHNALGKQVVWQKKFQHSLRHFRFLENTKFYNWMIEARFYSAVLEEVRGLARTLPGNRYKRLQSIHVPFAARAYMALHRARYAFYATGVVMVGFLLLGIYSLTAWSGQMLSAYIGRDPQRMDLISQSVSGATPTPTPLKYRDERIWMVEKSNDEEHYSNGARIFTKYETDNHRRGYYLIPRGSDTDGDQLRREVVGIVYHTSESDIVSFTADNNDLIQRRSQGLANYIKREKLYNYLIDRYGGIYRVVRDDQAANHAGYSVWADNKYTYVRLNESFIGVCFESTVNAGPAEQALTPAQIDAGRQLTNVLRKKYNIDDVNCTAHGLVSVNPNTMLIAFHHDWARNFPWEEMGLSDKYKIKPANVSEYGFTYDDEVVAKLGGEIWEGAKVADQEFKKRAERERVDPDTLRRKLLDRFTVQYNKVRSGAPGRPDNMSSIH
ncbi:MAG TPA: peptidoglycan recognition family protein [Blastocatellia bacterium]|nr:peptidoglycan recognition family protein [Blastocatellia bacterium]